VEAPEAPHLSGAGGGDPPGLRRHLLGAGAGNAVGGGLPDRIGLPGPDDGHDVALGGPQEALRRGRSNLVMFVPLLSMPSLAWLEAGEPELGGLVSYGFSRLALGVVSVGQVALAALMAFSVLGSVDILYRSRSRLR